MPIFQIQRIYRNDRCKILQIKQDRPLLKTFASDCNSRLPHRSNEKKWFLYQSIVVPIRCSLLEQQYYSYREWSIISMRIISAVAQKNSFSSSRKKEKGRGGRYPSLVQKATFPSVIYRFHQESVAARCDETGRDGTRPFFVGPARRGNGAQPTLRTHSSTERLETARRLLSHAL